MAANVEVKGPVEGRFAEIVTPEALEFLGALHRRFDATRKELLEARAARQARFDTGENPDFLPETQSVRDDDSWRVAPAPEDLQDRRVEITGPTDRRMVINALNCGARVFMADFEDANTPTWDNMVDGHVNLKDAVRREIRFEREDGRVYELNEEIATLLVRPRGWHLIERHIEVDGEPISGSLFDFGLYFFHNAKELLSRGSGPYYYLAKLESYLEARLWNDVFTFSEEYLGVPYGSIKATVLIETILGAFEVEEIPLRAARPLGGMQRRALGLHLQRQQEVPIAQRPANAGPGPDHDDGALHARLHGAAGQDVPQAWRARHRRHGGVRPQPPRRRRQRRRDVARQGRQAA